MRCIEKFDGRRASAAGAVPRAGWPVYNAARMTPDPVAQFLGTWGYPAYVLLFLATGFGSPVTEDLLLLTGGYLVAAGIFSWPVALPLSYGCVLATDVIIYSLGARLRTHSLARDGLVRRLVRPAHLRIATRWFGRFGDPVVFVARLLPGTRLIVIERVLGEGLSSNAYMVDLHMMMVTGGRERTLDEYGALAASAGLAVTGATRTAGDFSLIESRRAGDADRGSA